MKPTVIFAALALSCLLTIVVGAQGANAEDSTALANNLTVPVRLTESPAFSSMIEDGLKAGDRGHDQENRFDLYIAQFLDFTEPSQEFVLSAYA